MEDLLNKVTVHYLKKAYHNELKNVFGHLAVNQRLERDYDILVRSSEYVISIIPLEETGGSLQFSIKGLNDTYVVIQSQQSCSCPDQEKLCKHRLMIKLLL